MKTPQSTLSLALLFAAVTGLLLNVQQGSSKPPAAAPAASFNAHYCEYDIKLGLGQSANVALPVLNRAVRVAITMTSDQDGEVNFVEVPSVYSNNPGFEGLTMQFGTGYFTDLSPNNMFSISSGGMGAMTITAAEDKRGCVHVSMWY